ncbi:pilus assembly protein [Ruania suaedae]|uniref:TadE family type IV pilus minor pilin n=1 Tax=Ruania suaedae TaxID=2897774 RepID=UPI001E332E49|nr:TadE family type IV pilus minor pilin [Ruania suaedae]UFU03405.1 pilus assembly protein [Ruania suaedae]
MAGVRAPRERGSVTAELAVLLPAVVLVLVIVLTAAAAGAAHVRCADAARAGARAAALGESPAEVEAIAERLAGGRAQVQVSHQGQWVRVEVRATLPLGPLAGLIPISAQLSTPVEPGLTGALP